MHKYDVRVVSLKFAELAGSEFIGPDLSNVDLRHAILVLISAMWKLLDTCK